jgi:CheY-like chemotaxis protein
MLDHIAPETHVLVVHDQAEVREERRAILRDAGCRVTCAADASTAWRWMKGVVLDGRSPDLVLLDLDGTDGGGLGLLHAMAADPWLVELPVAVTTEKARGRLPSTVFAVLSHPAAGDLVATIKTAPPCALHDGELPAATI